AAAEIAERLDGKPRLGAVHAAQALTFNLLGRLDRSITAGARARTIARALGDRRLDIASTLYLGQAYTWLGEYRQALQLLRPAPEDLLGQLGASASARPSPARCCGSACCARRRPISASSKRRWPPARRRDAS